MSWAGPVAYLVLEFPDACWRGAPLRALLDLVERGVIRVLDLRVVRRAYDGSYDVVTLRELEGDGTLDLRDFDGVESGLLDTDDLGEVARVVEPGSAAGLLVYENAWAAPFVTAVAQTGARLVAGGLIPAPDLLAAIDRLDAAG